MSATRRHSILIFVALLGLGAGAASSANVIGQMANEGILDGNEVISGTTVFDPALLQSGDRMVMVHLRNGGLLALEPESATRVMEDATGALVAVGIQGRAYLRHGEEVLVVAENRTTRIAALGQAAGADTVRLCQLRNSNEIRFQQCLGGANSCNWDLLVVAEGEVGDHVGVDSVRAGQENNNLGLDDDCNSKSAGGGMGPGKKVGIGVGAGLGAVVLGQLFDDDDPPASRGVDAPPNPQQ